MKIKKDDLGKTFDHMGDTYVITGCKPRSTKYPILAEHIYSKKTYKFPAIVISQQTLKDRPQTRQRG